MGNKAQQDAYVDDTEDTCPLCVEEFDLSDKNFKPCPCGYQVCQFCFNNIKNNMNGLCPACRRPYDEKTIEWKVVSPEEFKADVAAQARKKAAARQKEAERKQVETLNKKHLAGLRVLQKNLVYVIGMDISGDEQALDTLSGPKHFGQYGEIIKIVASKAKEGYAGHHTTGVYVTFARKEDAANCIAAVDGTPHEGRVLRAQYGTTKYCSSFLRNERCANRNCMFLHETGDDSDSFSRQDLSSFNAASSQRSAPSSAATTARITYHNPTQIASPAHTPATVAQVVKAEAMSRSDSGGDGPALPTTATWAKNSQIEQSRRSSLAPTRDTPSPKPSTSKLVLPRPDSRADTKAKIKKTAALKPTQAPEPESEQEAVSQPLLTTSDPYGIWVKEMKLLETTDLSWKFNSQLFKAKILSIVEHHPPLFNLDEGVCQIIKRKKREPEESDKTATTHEMPEPGQQDEESQLRGGSLQLGGEPDSGDDFLGQHSSRDQAAFGIFNDLQSFDRPSEYSNSLTEGRGLTPHQQRNIALLRAGTLPLETNADQGRPSGTSTSQHHSQLSNPFVLQNQHLNNLSRHGRQTSRFTFNADGSGSGPIKPSANAQKMAQLGSNVQKGYGVTQSGMQSAFYSGVQGPPPGLKATGTPPIGGGGMFGQGHGFASTMGGASGFGGNLAKGGEENTRDPLNSRSGGPGGKLDLTDPSILQARMHHPSSAFQNPYSGNQAQESPNFIQSNADLPILPQVTTLRVGSRSETPSTPPGLGPAEFPPLIPAATTGITNTASTKSSKLAVPPISKPSTPKPSPTTVPIPLKHNELSTKLSSPAGQTSAVLTTRDSFETREDQGVKNAGSEAPPLGTLQKSSIALDTDTQATSKHTQGQSEAQLASAEDGSSIATFSGHLQAADEPVTEATSEPEAAPRPLPLMRNPRTLRLVTTIKTEDSSVASTPVDTTDVAASSTVAKPPNSSIPSTKQPSTPVNDILSETVSLTSATTSRHGSPGPHSRIHTGPTMVKSKNQIKKERQARAKQLEETKTGDNSAAEEAVQAPIIGRKKKVKKPKSAPATQPTSRVTSATQSKHMADSEDTNEDIQEPPVYSNAQQQATQEDVVIQADSRPVPEEHPVKETRQVKPVVTVASVLSTLKSEGILTAEDLELFLNPSLLNTKYDVNAHHIFRYEKDTKLAEDEKDTLDRGNAIAKQINAGEWAVILPDRTVLRQFTKKEAMSFVQIKYELDHNATDTFSGDFPFSNWADFTSNDVLSGYQVAPPLLDGSYNNHLYSAFDSPEYLIDEFSTTLFRPDENDRSYSVLYPPRNQAENEEIEARMAMYTLEEAEQTVRASEELLFQARKETELAEKKLLAVVRKNRKIAKDWL